MNRQKRRTGAWIPATLRGAVSVAVAWVLCMDSAIALPGAPAAAPSSQAPTVQRPTLQEQVVEMPPGSLVEVRLKSKERVRGRLGEVSNEGFLVKQAKKDKVEDRKIAFGDVKSIKSVGKASAAGRAVLYVLAGAGVVFLILALIVASHED